MAQRVERRTENLRAGLRHFRDCQRADKAANPVDRGARLTLLVWRLGQAGYGHPGAAAFVLRRAHTVADSLWTRGVIGGIFPRSAFAGPGFVLPHAGRGVVIHPTAQFGTRVKLYHHVTVGVVDQPPGSPPPTAPRIGDDVILGTACCVIGAVTVGDGARVGANAVVVRDVPAGATAVGVPATILPPRTARTTYTPDGRHDSQREAAQWRSSS